MPGIKIAALPGGGGEGDLSSAGDARDSGRGDRQLRGSTTDDVTDDLNALPPDHARYGDQFGPRVHSALLWPKASFNIARGIAPGKGLH